MNIVGAVTASDPELPPIQAQGYEYVVAVNGVFIRAEDSRVAAMVPVRAGVAVPGFAVADGTRLHAVAAYAQLKLPRVPRRFLNAVLLRARQALPDEIMVQFLWTGSEWRCVMPAQDRAPARVAFADDGAAVIDLHSHGDIGAFFSSVDDADELGLRFYVVVGRVGRAQAEIVCRVGVYGHHMLVTVDTVFDMEVEGA